MTGIMPGFPRGGYPSPPDPITILVRRVCDLDAPEIDRRTAAVELANSLASKQPGDLIRKVWPVGQPPSTVVDVCADALALIRDADEIRGLPEAPLH